MRVTIITEGYLPELSGVTISLHKRLEILSKWGHEVQLLAPNYRELEQLYPDYQTHIGSILPGVEVIPYPSRPYYVDYARDAKPCSFKQMADTSRTFTPDVIHVECAARLCMGVLTRPGVKLARQMKKPVTAIYHTNYLAYIEDYKKDVAWLRLPGIEKLLRNIVVWVYNSYDATAVPTQTTNDYLRAQGVRNTQMDKFYGIDTQMFMPNTHQLPALYQSLTQSTKVLYVGRLTPDKQIQHLMQAIDTINKQSNQCSFIMIGGGTEEDAVRRWAANYKNVFVLGRVPHEQLPPYYSHADIFVTASPKENYPLTVMEAMSSGLPIIAPASGGLIDQVTPNETGFLVNPTDHKELATAIYRLANDASLQR